MKSLPYIVFEATTSCNLNCSYCYTPWERRKIGYSHLNSYKNAIKTLKKLFSRVKVNQITMTGGEPFLSERFMELVLFCRMKGSFVSIITNGNSANEKDYIQLIDFGVNLFELPIHSATCKIHDSMTGVKGSWKKSVNTVKEIIKNNAEAVAVTVITKLNCNVIGETIDFIYSLGIKRIMLNRYNIGGRSINNYSKILPDFDELNTAYSEANKLGKNSDLTITSNVCTPFCVLNPDKYPYIQFSSCASVFEKMPLTLDLLGNLRLCNHSPTVMGNIFKLKIEDILNSEKVKFWHSTIPDYCTDCKRYSKCKGGCRAASEQLGYSLKKIDPIVNILRKDRTYYVS
ncbi:MAG TPA: radical SAM protein [Victivallales bacterium]|nr:radical SAM protein [Victivallales bacterium]